MVSDLERRKGEEPKRGGGNAYLYLAFGIGFVVAALMVIATAGVLAAGSGAKRRIKPSNVYKKPQASTGAISSKAWTSNGLLPARKSSGAPTGSRCSSWDGSCLVKT